LLFNSFMLLPLHDHVFTQLSFYHLHRSQLQAGHLIFVGTNCLLAVLLGKRMAIEYLGQVNVLALVTILLLTILMFTTLIFSISESTILLFLVLITAFTIKEYVRRMNYAGIMSRHKTIVWINILCLTIFLGYVFH
jgi:hypothetical protein